jgi:hypothetical protein
LTAKEWIIKSKNRNQARQGLRQEWNLDTPLRIAISQITPQARLVRNLGAFLRGLKSAGVLIPVLFAVKLCFTDG